MQYDSKYCYPDSNVLMNKLGIRNQADLLNAEKEFTSVRLIELQENPVKGRFDFVHFMKIHKYIFQDLYDWAGKIRTVDIGKGNLFCRVQNLISYGNTVFETYYPKCYENRNNKEKFVEVFTEHYADVNALHPFREGNGRTQREFARELCYECGYEYYE